ncbi:unnamed protein product [Linum trigynum]|uniref:Uncharacterized protein n=1 Tax=Linum trigynum TaxID=586398 RepID=A0AAV2CLB7_9ROSI
MQSFSLRQSNLLLPSTLAIKSSLALTSSQQRVVANQPPCYYPPIPLATPTKNKRQAWEQYFRSFRDFVGCSTTPLPP